MLDALRRGATGWIAKIFLTVLIVSFAVWGVADVFRGYGSSSLARVGDIEISPDDFQTTYRNQLDMLGQMGRRITPDQAQALGLPTRALYGLIDTAALDNHARSLHLGISDETLAQQIAREPSFRTSEGKFDKDRFQSFLNQIRMSEQGFLALRRKDEVREQLKDALQAAVAPPDAVVAALHAWREETRRIEHLTIPEGAVTVPEPDEAKLKETWEQAKSQFTVPERRRLGVLLLEPDAVKARVEVGDADVKAYFDQNRASLDIPERRRIQQIAFKDRAAADAGKKAIAGGKGFLMVALETEGAGGRLPGLIARSDIGDLKLAEAIFSLEKDKVSDVIQTASGPMLIMVSEILPGKARSLDEVKDEIRERLQAQKVNDEINSLHDAVDNQRAARKPLKEIAEALKLKFIEVTTERTNKTPEGKTALEMADAAEIIEHGFQGLVGAEQEPFELKGGGHAWVDVLEIMAEKEKPLDTVKDEVKAVYVDSQHRKLLAELANKVLGRIESGESLEAVGKELNAKVEATEPVTRSTTPQGLSTAAVQIAFATAKGKVAAADSADRKSRTIVRVADIIPAAPPTKEQAERLSGELTRQMQGDAVASYAVALRERYGVRINDAAVKRAIGGDRQQ